MLKDTLKYLRSVRLINIPIRWSVYFLTYYSQQLFQQFTEHWPVTGIVKLTLPGDEELYLFSEGDDGISTKIFWKGLGGYEGKSEFLFYALAKRSQNIIDIGANIGFYSLIAAAANRNSRVYSFEPAEDVYCRLLKHIEINGSRNITPEAMVVSNNSNPIKFYVPEGKGIGLALAASTKKGWVTKTREVVMSSISLDEYKNRGGVGKIDLIKMDCEFHEKEVLEGMQDILKNDRPDILMEVLFQEADGVGDCSHYCQSSEIEDIMKRHDYHFYLIGEDALIRMDRLEHNPDNRNYLFSSKKSRNRYVPYSKIDFLYTGA